MESNTCGKWFGGIAMKLFVLIAMVVAAVGCSEPAESEKVTPSEPVGDTTKDADGLFGMDRIRENRFEFAIMGLTRLINSPDTSRKTLATALFARGTAYYERVPPNAEAALADYARLIDMPDAPTDLKASALNNRGVIYSKLNPPQSERAIADWTTVIEMPDAGTKARADALINRGTMYGKGVLEGTAGDAIADFTQVVDMAGVASRKRAEAIFRRGLAYALQDPPEVEAAIADWNRVLEMADSPEGLKAWALFNIACGYSLEGEYENCQLALRRAIDLDLAFARNTYDEDESFDPVRDKPWFQEFLDSLDD